MDPLMPQNQMPSFVPAPPPAGPPVIPHTYRTVAGITFGIVILGLAITAGALMYQNYYAPLQTDYPVYTPRPSTSPISTVPADWKTYATSTVVNLSRNFQIAIPSGWTTTEVEGATYFRLKASSTRPDLTFSISSGNLDTGTPTSATLGGNSLTRYTFAGNSQIILAIPYKTGWSYYFAFDKSIESVVDQILSTFTFTTPTGWKTYTDPQYGFSFQYPSGYVASEPNTSGSGGLKTVMVLSQSDYQAWVVQHGQGDGPANALLIHVFSNPDSLAPLAWAKTNNIYSNFSDGLQKESYTTSAFAGQSAISYTRNGLWTLDIMVVQKRKTTILTDISYSTKNAETRDFFQILSTFQFTK